MQVFLTPNYLGIVTDFADQGELATQITEQAAHSGCADMAFTEPEARHLFQQLIIAVDFCHRKGISNRDLKVLSPRLAGRLCWSTELATLAPADASLGFWPHCLQAFTAW